MPGFTVTRGLGPGATPSALIARGFFATVATEVIRIVRGGRGSAKRLYEENWALFKVSAGLVAYNGMEAVNPLYQNIKKTFTKSEINIKRASTISVEHKKPENIKVSASITNVRNKKNVKH